MLEDRGQRLPDRPVHERPATGEHLVEHTTQREEVAARIGPEDRAACSGDIVSGACRSACRRRPRASRPCFSLPGFPADESGQAEVEHLHRTPAAVRNTLPAFTSRCTIPFRVREGQRSPRSPLRDPAPLRATRAGPRSTRARRVSPSAQLHHRPHLLPRSRPTSWIATTPGCASAAIARVSRSKRRTHPIRAREVGVQHLDRDVAPELRVVRAVDFGHPALADPRAGSHSGPSCAPGASGASAAAACSPLFPPGGERHDAVGRFEAVSDVADRVDVGRVLEDPVRSSRRSVVTQRSTLRGVTTMALPQTFVA